MKVFPVNHLPSLAANICHRFVVSTWGHCQELEYAVYFSQYHIFVQSVSASMIFRKE